MAVRVLFVTPTWHTHFFNLVPLAWSLQTAGHDVRVACEPELVDTVTRSGLTAVPVGSDEPIRDRARRAEEDGTLPPLDMGRLAGALGGATSTAPKPSGSGGQAGGAIGDPRAKLSWEDMVWLYETVAVPRGQDRERHAVRRPGGVQPVVAAPARRLGRPHPRGPVAAGAVGAAHARVTFTVDLSFQLRSGFLWTMAQQPPERRRDPLAEWLGSWTEKFGYEYSETLVNAHATIDQFPPSFGGDYGASHLNLRYVPYNGPAVIPDWLNEPPPAPRVLMTLGVSMSDWQELQVMSIERVQEVLDSVAGLDMELVLTLPTAFREKLDRVPRNTRIVEFAPFHAVLPTCAAMIHHGGAGTFYNALLAGTPQLLITKVPDALHKRAYLAETGAGLSIPPDEVTGPKVRESLARLLDDPSFRAGAERIRREVLDQPTPNGLVPELERLAARHGPA
ncbi:DUF1205 domain-containing protein [Actinomadura sp. J1-007]|nr:nucleotide disphospho-sugar-binding domain-containing protein [Actinomadura sp. J1-007]MWK40682.1 DUF1205 domain-containing protein [Actinomadura sp. J1-007]QFU19836.1 glycosyltransferase [Actinomadura sp.]